MLVLLRLLTGWALAQPDLEARQQQVQERLDSLLKAPCLRGQQRQLSYRSLVPLAILRNLSLQASQLEVPLAQAEWHEAEAARNPTLTNGFFYVHQDKSLVLQNLPNTRFVLLAAGFTLTQSTLYPLGENELLNRTTLFIPIYTGGRLESTIHLRKALVEAAQHGEERTRQQLAFLAKQQFLATLLARENLRVAGQILARAEEIESYGQAHLKTGTGTRLDVLQAQVAVANAHDAVTRTQSSLRKAETDLAATLDLPLLTDFQLLDDLSNSSLLKQEPLPGGDLLSRVQYALERRPELQRLRSEQAANRERENVARADELPQLGLNLNYDLIGNPANLNSGPSLAAVLTIPLWDGGVGEARIRQVKIRDLQLKTDEVKLIQDIGVEVRQASLQLEEAESRLGTMEAARNGAAETLRISTLRYQVGAGTSLELVSAQTVLANAEFALADARYRVIEARAQLNYALGAPIESGQESEVPCHG